MCVTALCSPVNERCLQGSSNTGPHDCTSCAPLMHPHGRAVIRSERLRLLHTSSCYNPSTDVASRLAEFPKCRMFFGKPFNAVIGVRMHIDLCVSQWNSLKPHHKSPHVSFGGIVFRRHWTSISIYACSLELSPPTVIGRAEVKTHIADLQHTAALRRLVLCDL